MCQVTGEVVVLGQHVGGDVQLRVFGDEFYARYETLDGHTVLYDTDAGRYCYALLAAGRLVSSGVPISKPPPDGVPRHLMEDGSIRGEVFGLRYDEIRPQDQDFSVSGERTFGPDDGLLSGRTLHEGVVVGLTLLVDFVDVKTRITADDVSRMMNEPGYTDHGNACSVRDYFLQLSSGRLDYSNVVVGPIQLSKRRSHYINNSLVEEAIDLAVSQHGVDLSAFDSRGEGIVDAINILYAGQSQYVGKIWPHNSVKEVVHNGVRTHFYQLTGLGSNPVDLRIGTICHENGHLLCRFPDMYDYGKRDQDNKDSAGIGRYCLMGSGNHLDNRRTPSPVCAYLRYLAGWANDVVMLNTPGAYQARHGAYDQVMKYELPAPNEFFLVENRSRLGLDAHLPSSGLAVYHCDTRGSNEWQDGTKLRHYQCALIQADGRRDLENDNNSGDADDLYRDVPQIALAHDTVPHTRRWDGADSGLTISAIGSPGEIIDFTVGEPIGPRRVVSGQSFPDLLIPDADVEGAHDVITLDTTGSVVSVGLTVNIIHTWIGDLTVTLIAPDGSRIVVHDRSGTSKDDIHLDIDPTSFPALGDLAGGPAGGPWTLEAIDHASRDVGRLLDWGVAVEVEDSGRTLSGTNTTVIAIPDNDAAGIASSIDLGGAGGGGQARTVAVEVDVEHTYIGDLQIDLVSPAGAVVRLHDRSGGTTNDLVRTWDSRTDTALAALVGAEVSGEWRLLVRDLARVDHGSLRSWTVSVTV
jgi:M6 family metalloprotease-like protein